MHCLNCGIEAMAGAAFCPSCGKPVGDPAAIGPPAAAGLQTNVAGALCYLVGFVTGILFLVMGPYNRDRFVRFHAFQSIFLSATLLVAYFGLHIVVALLPGFLWRLVWMLSSLISLGCLLLALLLMYKAYHREKFKLPVIGDLAERQA